MSLDLLRRSRMSFTCEAAPYKFSMQQAKSPSIISSRTKETNATQTKFVKLNLVGSASNVSHNLIVGSISNS